VRVVAWITIAVLASIALRAVLHLIYALYSGTQLGLADAAIAGLGLFAAWASHVVFKTLIGPRASR